MKLQFRLRTLLMVVALLAVVCAVSVPLVREWLKPVAWPVPAPPNYKPPQYAPSTQL